MLQKAKIIMNFNIWQRQKNQSGYQRRQQQRRSHEEGDSAAYENVKRFKRDEQVAETPVEKQYEARIMAAQYKSQHNSLRKDLKKFLQDKPQGIPVDKLQASYCKHFHRNLNLKACGLKLADIVPTFSDILEEVKIDRTKYIRLRRNVKGEGSREKAAAGAKVKPSSAPASAGKPSTSQAGASGGNQRTSSSREQGRARTGPVSIDVPLDVFGSAQGHGSSDAQVAQRRAKDTRGAGHIDTQPAPPGTRMDPLEHQMQQYLATVRDSQSKETAHQGPQGANLYYTDTGGNPGALMAQGSYFGGAVPTGQFSFDQGSNFYSKFYDQTKSTEDSPKQKQASKSARSKTNVPSAKATESADPQNWPSLAEAQTAAAQSSKSSTKYPKMPTPAAAQKPSSVAKPPPPLMASRTSREPRRDRNYYGRGAFPITQITDYAQNCIINLAESNEHVSIDRVMTLVKQHFQVESIRELGLHGDYQLESIKQLQRLQTKINASIQAFVKVRAISTLHELHESLAALEKKNVFAEYNLGPLTKQPLIYDMFKFPTDKPDSEIPRITTIKILEVLRQYLTEKNLWRNRVKLEDFMEHVVKSYEVEDPYVLGIRFQSVGLGISVLKTAQREQKQIMDTARADVKTKVMGECQTAMQKIERAILKHLPEVTSANQFTPSSGPGLELRKTYVTMTAAQAINTVFENMCELIGQNHKLDRFAFHLSGVIKDPLACSWFQLALCLGSLKPPEELLPKEEDDHGSHDDDTHHHHQDNQQTTSTGGRGKQATDAEVLDELKRYLEKLERMGVPKLRDLASIEKKLCQKYEAQNFSHLLATHRTFLEFMTVDHPQVLEAFGGSLGVTNSNPMLGSPYRPSRMDIMEFIQQCDIKKRSSEAISAALCSHYKIGSVEELGQGQLAMLMKTRSSYGQTTSHPVVYEAALCTGSSDQKSQQVGLLGTQSLERALGCLNSAPLLEDLADWTHWELVFEPEHGDLKSFLETCPGAHLSPPIEIHAIETKPGVLLKLAAHTSPDQFSAHAQNGDATNAAGHLVSLVVQDGIVNVPLALLGNHVEAALAKRLRMDHDAGRSNLEAGEMLRFVVEMLTRIPVQIAQAVTQQVILKPLSSVIGSEAKSRELLLKACKTSAQRSKLQQLGLLLGISQWKAVIEERLPATIDNDDDLYEDDGEADVDVNSLLLAAASTPNVKAKEVKMEPRSATDVNLQVLAPDLPTSSEKEVITLDDETSTSQVSDNDIVDITEDKGGNVTIEIGDTSQEEEDEVILDDTEDEKRSDGDGAESDQLNEKSHDATQNNNDTSGQVIKTEPAAEPSGKDVEGMMKEETEDDKKGQEEDVSIPEVDMEEEEVEAVYDETSDVKVEEPEAEPELTESQRHIWSCKTVIDSVRHDEFGIGMHLNEQTRQLMQRHQERIGRSLQRLSEELYSKDTHFVLELIQNADDNKYEAVTKPSLVFVVDTEAVTAMNNERGFSEQDIRALCDVGKSTKGKHKHGYIGHKGIGFKSVFRVTDAPEIHSNGYHICFEHGKDLMGYILPTWIGPQDLNQLADFHMNADWATTIKLPLKGDIQRTSSLVNKFQDIQPSLLLFLHRLRSIVIVNKGEENTRKMTRQDIGDNIVEIKHNKVTESWLVVKETLDATKLHRERVESTELALAFPIKNGSSNIQKREQSVFAFLPLRSYGFHFIIQGDFDIPSSREDVDSDSAWNQWLQESIAPLFVKAINSFKDYYDDPIQAVCNFLQFIPLEDQILTEFFKKVAVSIHQRLKATPCLPIASESAEVEWRLPSETVMAKDPLIRDVLQSSVLKTHLNCHYLHQKVVEDCSTTLLGNLGVKKLLTSDLIGILKSIAVSAHSTGEHLPVQIVAKWLACIYRCRERDYDVSQDSLEQLRAIPIIPLTSGERVPVKDRTIFFPISADDKVSGSDKRHFQTGSHVLKAVEADMAMVDVRLLHSLDDIGNSQIRRMLEELGVRHISPPEVIHHHILPVLKDEEKWKAKIRHNYDILIGYLVYIKEQCEKQSSVCNLQKDLRPYAQVITNHGPCNPATTPVHFPKVYGNAIDLERELPGCDWVLLDSSYLTHRGVNPTKGELVGWQQFFTQLGVLCYLAVETKIVTLQESEMSGSPWADVSKFWPKPSNGVYKIRDHVCKEFEQLITYNANPETQKVQRHNLINHLHERWRESYASFMSADLFESSESDNIVKQVESSFDILLRTSPWLPAINDGVLEFKSPVDLFLYSQNLFNLLGTHVPYLTLALKADSPFLQFLRVRNDSCLSPAFMLAKLQTWCRYHQYDLMTPTGHGSKFKGKLGHMIRVYRYLFEECREKDRKELFDQYPAIFIPVDCNITDWKANQEVLIQGQFVHKKCTYWHDPTELLQKQTDKADADSGPQRFAVSEFYQEVQHLFLGKYIDQTPTLKEYVGLLVDVASEITLPNNEKLQDVLKIYGMLGKKCAEHSNKETGDMIGFGGETATIDSNSQSCKFLRGLLQEEPVFPTRSNRWVTLASKPILCDDDSAEFEKLFIDDQRVHLLNLADKDKLGRSITRKAANSRSKGVGSRENVKQFLEACQIEPLIDCVEREFISTALEHSPNVQLFVHTICPYIQRYISTHSQRDDNFHTLYQQLQEENISASLKTMAIFEVDKLEVVHRMKHQDGIFNQSIIECGMEKKALYVVKNVIGQLHRNTQVRREISKMFSKGIGPCQKALFNFLGSLVLSMEPSHFGKDINEELCTQLDLEPLEEGVEEWNVPKPIMPEIIRKPAPPVAPARPAKSEQPEEGQTGQDERKDGEGGLEGDAGLIRSWPPRSGAYGPTTSKGPKSQEDEAGLKMWPPPAPPATSSPFQPPPGSHDDGNRPGADDGLQRQTSVSSEGGQGRRSETGETSGDGKGLHRQVSSTSDGSSTGPRRTDGDHTGHKGGGEGQKASGPQQQTLGDFVKTDDEAQHPDGEEAEVVDVTDDEEEEEDDDVEEIKETENPPDLMEISVPESEEMSFHTPPMVRHTPGPYIAGTSGGSARRLRQMAPMWSILPTVEIEFEDLAKGAEINEYMSVLEISSDWDEAERNLQTGRWGEALVYNYLLQQSERTGRGDRVKWVNEFEETGQPFDVVIENEDATIYVEVKATKYDQKELFEISSKEVLFAEQKKESFHLYRVYNAGSGDSARLCRLQNLAYKMEKKEVRLAMYI